MTDLEWVQKLKAAAEQSGDKEQVRLCTLALASHDLALARQGSADDPDGMGMAAWRACVMKAPANGW